VAEARGRVVTDTLASSLVAALTELITIDKGRTADAGKYQYTYADIADLIAATRPVLAEHGIVALTPVHASEKGLACSVTLIHSSGEERVFDPLPFMASNDPQQAGSAITYFRRYALLAALGMATTDDDGAAGSEHARSSQGRKTRQAAPAPAVEEKGQPQRPMCPICEKPLTGKDSVVYGAGFAHESCAAS
jgi:hypothetical protein